MTTTDFVNQTDWSRYTIADLLAEIEGHADTMRGATLYDLSWIMEPARALAERAERAEAAAEQLQAALDGLEAALRDATGYSADPDSVDWPPTEATP